MLSKLGWLRIAIVVGSLSICWLAAIMAEDAGMHPYRDYQRYMAKQRKTLAAEDRIAPAPPDPLDGLLPFMR